MPPYNPPVAHYVHVDVSMYDSFILSQCMQKFYVLTNRLRVKYIWLNQSKKIIEIWGSYDSMLKHDPAKVIRDELDKLVSRNRILCSECELCNFSCWCDEV